MLAMGCGNSLHSGPRSSDRRESKSRLSLGWAVLGTILVLSGCATTQVQRAEQLGMLGKTYANAVTLAGDEAMAISITFSLTEIRQLRADGAFSEMDMEGRKNAINLKIDILKQRQQLVETSNQLLAMLAEYFAGLEEFAKQDISTPFETETGGLVDSINKAGNTVEKNPEAKKKISDAERASIAKLSGLVARQVHGQALARVLERDAPMIGTQLKLMSKILATYSEWIRARSDMELKEFYRDRVVKPFVGTGELPESWDQDVRRYLQGTSLSEQLAKAQDAGERMERFWTGYLAGEISISAVVADLKDMERLLQAISDFAKARTDASAAKPQ